MSEVPYYFSARFVKSCELLVLDSMFLRGSQKRLDGKMKDSNHELELLNYISATKCIDGDGW